MLATCLSSMERVNLRPQGFRWAWGGAGGEGIPARMSRGIVSLWKVDDDATKALRVKFYELRKSRLAATALLRAQRFVASEERWRDPRYWAAWQLWRLPE